MIKDSMQETHNCTNSINLASAKDHIEFKALIEMREETGKLFNKPVICDMI